MIFFRKRSIFKRFKYPIILQKKNKKVKLLCKKTKSKVPRFSYASKWFHSTRSKIKGQKRRDKIPNFLQTTIGIQFQRKNTFLDFKYGRQKHFISAGLCGYKTRQKSNPYVREKVSEMLSNLYTEFETEYTNIIFKKKIGKFYKPVLTGLAKGEMKIGFLKLKHIHAHGKMREKKKRRI